MNRDRQALLLGLALIIPGVLIQQMQPPVAKARG